MNNINYKKICLNEVIIKDAITKSIIKLITEDREGKNMKRARDLVKQTNPGLNPMEVITRVRNLVPHSRLNQCEYLKGVTRMYLNGELSDNSLCAKLNKALELLATAHANEYDNDLNGLSAKELVEKFSGLTNDQLIKDVDSHNKLQWSENTAYKIIPILSTEDAWPFSKYTDWCITSTDPNGDFEDEFYDYDENAFDPYENPEYTLGYEMYNHYTHDGLGMFYFCLRNDYETVERVPGENFPLDDYGLSMIAVSIDENGAANTITTRWNHAKHNGIVAGDKAMTTMELSKIIGRNFYSTFRQLSQEELKARGVSTFKEIEERIANGEDYRVVVRPERNLTSDLIVVSANKMKNILDKPNKRLLLKPDKWAYSIGLYSDGLIKVRYENGLLNFVREDGSFLFDNDVNEFIDDFENGYAVLSKSELVNGKRRVYVYFIDTNGNVTNKNNPICNDSTYHEILQNRVAIKSYVDELYKLYNLDGTLAFKYKFKDIDDYKETNLLHLTIAENEIDDKEREVIIKPNNEVFLKRYFRKIYYGNKVFIAIDEDYKYRIYRTDETQIGDTYYDKAQFYVYGGKFIRVELNGKFNIIDTINGNYLFKPWADNIFSFSDTPGRFIVVFGKKYYLHCFDSKRIFENYFDSITEIKGTYGTLLVKKNGKSALINYKNEISPWYDNISVIFNNICICDINGQKYRLDNKTFETVPYTSKLYDDDLEEYEIRRQERRDEMGS